MTALFRQVRRQAALAKRTRAAAGYMGDIAEVMKRRKAEARAGLGLLHASCKGELDAAQAALRGLSGQLGRSTSTASWKL